MYSGKALAGLVAAARADPEAFRDKDVLFWHTGGGLGLYDKAVQLGPVFPPDSASNSSSSIVLASLTAAPFAVI